MFRAGPRPTRMQAILTFLNQTIPKKWEHFRDRINDNFRVISPANFRIVA